ncbi:MAG: nucleotidyltransferase domain-containing protein [Desulfamplus sp.]
MVQLPDKVRNIIECYLNELDKHNIPIREAMLFGSYAKGNYNKWSDIDIALVSEIFTGDFMENKDKIRKITLSVSSQIEVIPFSLSDFNLQNPLAKEIITTGIKLRTIRQKQSRPFGLCREEFSVSEDFNRPLSEDIIDSFQGSKNSLIQQ